MSDPRKVPFTLPEVVIHSVFVESDEDIEEFDDHVKRYYVKRYTREILGILRKIRRDQRKKMKKVSS